VLKYVAKVHGGFTLTARAVYADAGGRPISHPVLCYTDWRERIARDKAAGLKVYDDREAS